MACLKALTNATPHAHAHPHPHRCQTSKINYVQLRCNAAKIWESVGGTMGAGAVVDIVVGTVPKWESKSSNGCEDTAGTLVGRGSCDR